MLEGAKKLLSMEGDLVVTIAAPLDRHLPNNEKDRIKLRNLHAQARASVLERTIDTEPKELLQQLDNAVGRVHLDSGALGYIVVATPNESETYHLSFPVVESVALGTNPATRGLIQGLRRSPRYRLLVVSDLATRLFEGVRDDLLEVTDHGFPFAADVVPRDLRAIAGRFARKPGGDDKEQWRNFYRTVDEALTVAIGDEPLPIVLADVDVSTAMFEDVSDNTSFVVGRISGAHDDATAHRLGTKSWPLLRTWLNAQRREIIAELGEAAHAQKAVTGIDEVWQFAREGSGRTLVVEESYRADPARETDQRLVWSAECGPEIMDDPVDELIEHVVRSGGSVEFVADESLAHLGRVGLFLR